MTTLARRAQRSTNIWPGFVDALATLLMVIIFLLMVFVLAQFFLGEALSGRDAALRKLQIQITDMSDLLSLERKANENMRLNIATMTDDLQASLISRDNLKSSLSAMTQHAESLSAKLTDSFAVIEADKETIEAKVQELAKLTNDIAALKALREEMETKITDMSTQLKDKDNDVAKERNIAESARAQIALANRQMAALREQLARLSEALEVAEQKAEDRGVQISSLGKRLNSALATKVQELSRYRSEFFGRLREVLGNQPGIRIVGDRFVFQSEVLFASASAELGEEGQNQLRQLATTLLDIMTRIPSDIDWILRIDGHTDNVPISNWKFPSNWELSAARAISVVKFLIAEGISADRLAAAGFGEFRPLDMATDEVANRRNRRIEMKMTQR
ncbi:MAG: peptidoglycan -binding protein [Rhodospirillaceae bacterium]|nr:peptidoglycan -binding protein [Rhodospirillaceae bacterium]MBL6942150.1 peptidoglycan -binding protein [Rhodospirillales bacterium]